MKRERVKNVTPEHAKCFRTLKDKISALQYSGKDIKSPLTRSNDAKYLGLQLMIIWLDYFFLNCLKYKLSERKKFTGIQVYMFQIACCLVYFYRGFRRPENIHSLLAGTCTCTIDWTNRVMNLIHASNQQILSIAVGNVVSVKRDKLLCTRLIVLNNRSLYLRHFCQRLETCFQCTLLPLCFQ